MQYSVDPTLLLESDKPKEVILPMQSSVNPTLLLEGDAFFDHILSISSHVPFGHGRILIYPSTLPPCPRVVYFDRNDLVEPRFPSSTPFYIRGILRYIVEKVTSASILSSSTWKALGFPKLVLAICDLLIFDRIPAREPWPPPLYAS